MSQVSSEASWAATTERLRGMRHKLEKVERERDEWQLRAEAVREKLERERDEARVALEELGIEWAQAKAVIERVGALTQWCNKSVHPGKTDDYAAGYDVAFAEWQLGVGAALKDETVEEEG